MNNESISFKLKIFSFSIITLTILSIIYSCTVLYNKNNFYPTVNKGRLLVNSEKTKIEDCIKTNYTNKNIKFYFKYAAIDLNGKVLMSTINAYKVNSMVNLHDFIQYDHKYSSANPKLIKYTEPLINDNSQIGTVIFLIPKGNFLNSNPLSLTALEIIPLLIFLGVIVTLTIYLCFFLKDNVMLPLSDITECVKRILSGDFSYRIKYDYDTEVGTFCHSFEEMRDELKFSKEKEAAVKVSQKELLACISHDIKTPLTAIHGYVSGIKDGIVKDRSGIENYCLIILRRVKMLNKLLEDILESSKAELNKMNITLSEFYCGEFFKNILEDLSIEVKSKGLEFKAPSYIPDLIVNADKKRISQVMYNLVSNSIKYSKEEGEISIYFKTDSCYLNVYVKDTGIGISSADIPYIFKKFFRGEKSRNQNIPGSGLGLSISKYIVEAHGGFINCVESSANGTTMCFSLPL